MIKYFVFFLGCLSCFSQKEIESITFFRPEFLIGRSIPSYELTTGLRPQLVLGASYAKKNKFAKFAWQKLLNNATTGVSLYVTNYGSKEKGNSLSIFPFIEFSVNKKQTLHTKLAIGASYFDNPYHITKNPLNNAISADFSWAIQGVLYYDLHFKKLENWRVGLGYFHHSNGHTKLPNQGLNSALLSISTTFGAKNKLKLNDEEKEPLKIKKYGDWFYALRYGQGYHAFVTEDSKLKQVNSFSVTGGIFYKEFVKLSFGVNYRFYKHYYDYIKENDVEPYNDNPFKNSSNIYLTVGAEALLGRIGVDWEGGLNLYKPFYRKHYDLQKNDDETKYKLKNLFLGRLGLKLYAINNDKKPANNFYLAAHINSNLSQADFSEISVGFVHRIFKNN